MKILFLGDYSNLHACLAKELRRRGHDVTVVSDKGAYMQTQADFELRRAPGAFGSMKYLYRVMASLPSWKDYDVVQLINPGFLKLRCGRLRMIFDILKKNNKSVFLTLCGNDYFFVKDCVETDLFRFSEFRIGDKKTPLVEYEPVRETGWLLPEQQRYTAYLYSEIDGAMSVLPEYDMSARRHMDPCKIAFTNLPVDLDTLPFSEMNPEGKTRILVGIRGGMELQKGTLKLLNLCKEIESEIPDMCEVKAVSNLSLAEYIEELKKSHIVIDQLYSYSPATNALQTMALGRIAASGAQPEYYSYIGEEDRPILCLSPDESDECIKQKIRQVILDTPGLTRRAANGRRLVERHNDVKAVADRFERHWSKILNHGKD